MARSASIAAGAMLAAGILLPSCSNSQASVNRRPQGATATASVVGDVQRVTVTTGDTYRFDPATIVVHPGEVTVVLVNSGKGAPHNWTLVGTSAATALASAGATRTVSFMTPSPGTYQVVCTIHKKQGQTGKLVVLPN
jgi:plastocyanin